MPQIVLKLVPLDAWHHKQQKTYAQYGVKTNIFRSGVAKSALVDGRQILFWQITKSFDMKNCLSKKDFSAIYLGTFGDSRSKYIRFHTILCICSLLLMMLGIQWYQFQDYLRHILRSEAGKTNFGWFYENETWESVRIFCHFDSFLPQKKEICQVSRAIWPEKLIVCPRNVLHRVQGPQLDLEMYWYGMMTRRSQYVHSSVAHWHVFGHLRTFFLAILYPPSGEGHVQILNKFCRNFQNHTFFSWIWWKITIGKIIKNNKNKKCITIVKTLKNVMKNFRIT